MKKPLIVMLVVFVLATLCLIPSVKSEVIAATTNNFTARIVSTAAGNAMSVYAADVDGDGDMDLMSASQGDDKIAWYENDGASPPSWTARTVSTAADSAQSVYAADVDGDGDIDLMSASANDNKIAWYENDGASPPSWTART
ncbi:FG-GAP repeat domain-containing protein, partial [Chloroflexota bacterium]